MLTKAPIPFKNLADYKARLFVDKVNEFKFIIQNGYDHPMAGRILRDQLAEIVGKAGRFPTYVEWRSSKNLRFDIMEKHGMLEPFLADAERNKFPRPLKLEKPVLIKQLHAKVLVDTREQQPLFNHEKTSINVGDYTFEPVSYTGVHIDRKSKEDFIGTFTAGFDRFERECEKARALDIQLVILVEASFSDCFMFKPSFLSRQKVTGENAFNGVRRISRKFNVQFVFVDGREKAKEYVVKILSNPELVKGYDLQYLVEKGYL